MELFEKDKIYSFLLENSHKSESGCRLWDGSRIWNNRSKRYTYGQLHVGYRMYMVHRLMAHCKLEFDLGSKLQVCHSCDVENCIEETHLFIGSGKDNMRDAANKGRIRNGYSSVTHCKSGHPLSGDNLYTTPSGYRDCKTCRRDAYTRYKAKKNGK